MSTDEQIEKIKAIAERINALKEREKEIENQNEMHGLIEKSKHFDTRKFSIFNLLFR